jgi:hypothetical protein
MISIMHRFVLACVKPRGPIGPHRLKMLYVDGALEREPPKQTSVR